MAGLLAARAWAFDPAGVEVPGNGVDEDCDGADTNRVLVDGAFAGNAVGELPSGWEADGAARGGPEGVDLESGDAVLWTGEVQTQARSVYVAVASEVRGAASCQLVVMWNDAADRHGFMSKSVVLRGGNQVVEVDLQVRRPPVAIVGLSAQCRPGGGTTVRTLRLQNSAAEGGLAGPVPASPPVAAEPEVVAAPAGGVQVDSAAEPGGEPSDGSVVAPGGEQGPSAEALVPVPAPVPAAPAEPLPGPSSVSEEIPEPPAIAAPAEPPPGPSSVSEEIPEPPAIAAPAEPPPVPLPVAPPSPVAPPPPASAPAPTPVATAPAPTAPGPATPPAPKLALNSTRSPTYTFAECQECHTSLGVSGHRPPIGNFCETCHVQTSPGTKDKHAVLVPADVGTCRSCHDPAYEGRTFPHKTAMERGCLSCHDPHDGGKKRGHLIRGGATRICFECHTSPESSRSVHTAVRRGMCGSCHDPHGAENRSLLRNPDPNGSCASCHAPQAGEHKVPHLPSAIGACNACHATHASDNDGLLKLPAQKVCYQCHEEKDTAPQVHSAVKLGRCAKCHDPHGSDHPRKLRGDPVSQVCFRCHDDDIQGRKVVHAPVAAGYCTMCHDPHQTQAPKNLRSPVYTTCTMCHADKDRPNVRTPHMAVKAYGCTVCHDPHASDNDFRLRKPIIKLCTSCHKGYDDGYHIVQLPAGGGHPVGGRKDPLREGRELVCTSCHDPHGTDNPRMWYRATERLVLCVECHRKTLAPESVQGESDFEKEARERAKNPTLEPGKQ